MSEKLKIKDVFTLRKWENIVFKWNTEECILFLEQIKAKSWNKLEEFITLADLPF